MLAAARSAIGRLMRRPAPKPDMARRFDAAAGGRRAHGFGYFGRVGPEVAGAAPMVRSRARALYANNPHVRNAVDNLVASLIGTGNTPSAEPDAIRRFNRWQPEADADGRTDFYGLQADIGRALIVDGEAFVQLLTTDEGVKLRLLPSELVDESKTAELPDGGYIVNGVEFDANGIRVAYWVLPTKPTDQFATYATPARIEASEIIHVMKPLGTGQVRGISWLAPIVVPANELDAIVDALAVGVKIAAMHAGFLIDQNGTGGDAYDGSEVGGILETGLEPGTLKRLPTGLDVKFSTPEQAKDVASFLRFNLQMLAAGLGVPEHLLSGDLSNANYSSLRAGLIPFRQRCEQTVYGTLVPQLLNPVWRRVMIFEVLSGRADAVPAVEWLPPAWAQVDPLKAIQADVAEVEAGLASRRQKVAERGWSVAELDREIAADRQRERELGLSFPPPAPVAPQTEREDA